MRAFVLACAVACSSGLHGPPSGPIRDAAFVKLGGIDQWITIRGANRANPILLVVHGGPGDAQSVVPAAYEGYEADFTVVQWDQRGAARTFRVNPTAMPEPDRVIEDGVELARYLARRFARPIIVVGHSWGSYLGTGQVGNWTENVQAQFAFLLSHARAAGDRETVAKLEAIGTPDPTSAEQYFSWWSVRNPYIAPSDLAWIAKLRASIKDDPATAELVGAGMQFSGKALVGAMLAEDLPRTVPRLAVPFIVIQGADDMITPTSVAASYVAVVQAPSKKMITIPNAGHFAIVTHVAEFRAALLRDVRPFAR